jgi:hypothetical protein
MQNRSHEMLTSGLVSFYDNVDACTWVLLEHFRWELFDHPPYSPDLATSDYHLYTYAKNWFWSQCFIDNELMEDDKRWLSFQAVDFLIQAYESLLPDVTSAQIPAVSTLRSSWSMYAFCCI